MKPLFQFELSQRPDRGVLRHKAFISVTMLAVAGGVVVYSIGTDNEPTSDRLAKAAQRNRVEPPSWSSGGESR